MLLFWSEAFLSKIVVSDVDGTLIYKGATFNRARFPLMLERLRQNGATFAVCSGRGYTELDSVLSPFTDRLFAVACDGACTYENGALLDGHPIDPPLLSELVAFHKTLGCAAELHAADTVYLADAPFALYSGEARRLANITRIDSVEAISEPIYKATFYGKIAESFAAPELRLCYRSNGVTEYVNAAASKHTAAESLLAHLSLTFDDLLYFGDGKNDASLLTSAGRSYTTYCADPAVFSLAEHHTRDVIGTLIRLCDSDAL